VLALDRRVDFTVMRRAVPMKRLVFALAVVVAALAVVAATVGQESPQGKAKARRTQERTVVIPDDTTPFEVERRVVVRLTGKGIAGAKIAAKVEGPARIAAASAIRRVREGKYLIGAGDKEFDIRPTGEGKVTVTITSTPPQPDLKPTVTTYQFDVR
jgi:hypothetical protein